MVCGGSHKISNSMNLFVMELQNFFPVLLPDVLKYIIDKYNFKKLLKY